MDATANTSTLDQGYVSPQPSGPVMSVKDWLITLLLLAIPFVNIVLLFVWAFGSDYNPNKSNYAKAALIWAAIITVLYILFFAMFGAALMGMGAMGN